MNAAPAHSHKRSRPRPAAGPSTRVRMPAGAKGASAKAPRATVVAGHVRTCAGCKARDEEASLVRVVLSEGEGREASVVIDARGGRFGRGAHVHPSRRCVALAAAHGLSRAFHTEVAISEQALADSIADAFRRRIDGLLSGGIRGAHVVVGTDAVVDALAEHRAALVLLACDAQAAAARSEIAAATASGIVLPFGDRARLARAIGRKQGEEGEGIAVLAVSDAKLAKAVRQAWVASEGMSAPQGAESSSRFVRSSSSPQAGRSHAEAE